MTALFLAATVVLAADAGSPLIDPSIATITGAAFLLIGTLVTVLFGRRSTRETSDLAAIRLLTESQASELARVKKDLEDLGEKYETLLEERREDDEKRRLEDERTGRLISNLRFYVTDLLQFIAREGGHEPPAPRFPID